jgi:hypothetical protein
VIFNKLAIPTRRERIPTHSSSIPFTSWSLFLVCNPAWLDEDNAGRLWELYEQYLTFGRAIGPKHLAVWFWTDKTPEPSPLDRHIAVTTKTSATKATLQPAAVLSYTLDVDRSIAYCEKFGLKPSESPHIIVTTRRPEISYSWKEAGFYTSSNQVVITLANADATEMTVLLTTLADQLLIEGLNQEAIDSKQYWQSWWRSLRNTWRPIGTLAEKLAVTIDTRIFKAELKPLATKMDQ